MLKRHPVSLWGLKLHHPVGFQAYHNQNDFFLLLMQHRNDWNPNSTAQQGSREEDAEYRGQCEAKLIIPPFHVSLVVAHLSSHLRMVSPSSQMLWGSSKSHSSNRRNWIDRKYSWKSIHVQLFLKIPVWIPCNLQWNTNWFTIAGKCNKCHMLTFDGP